MCVIVETKGDLFEFLERHLSENIAVSVAHCVSQDLHMGKGIAVTFKTKFGQVEELKAQKKKIGDVAVLSLPLEDPCFVYYLITKSIHFFKPTYESLKASLVSMKKHALENGVEVIVMPKIGCGLDRLAWTKVKPIIKEVFDDTSIFINVFYL